MFNTKLNLLTISFLQLISFSGFLLCSLSSPIIKSWGLARVGGMYYGAFGYCQEADVFFCSPVHLLYNASKVGLSDSSFERWWLNPKSRDTVGKLLISIPIATCFTLICSILPFVSFFLYPPGGTKVPLIILNVTLHTLSFLSTVFACIIILLQFHPFTTWCGWLTIPCSFCSFLACILSLLGCIHQYNQTAIIEKEASIENLDSILKLYGMSQTPSALSDKSSQATKSTVLSPSSKSVYLSTSFSNNLQRTLDPNQDELPPEIIPSVKKATSVNFFIPNLHGAPMFSDRSKSNQKTLSIHEIDIANLFVKQEDREMPVKKKIENVLYYEDITSPSQHNHNSPWLFGVHTTQLANDFKVYSQKDHCPTAPPKYQLCQIAHYGNQDNVGQNSTPYNSQRKLVGHNLNHDHNSHSVRGINEQSHQTLPEAYNTQNMLPIKYKPAYKQRIHHEKGNPQPAYTFH
ncbi:hypothetical protein SMKI_07G2740 [Saccharomyces mikatae IFO 1815]|uniref:Uncharacterized protein n=1 Tax=Saccharomyces mikatae IFO 1815 TaxID=226126 RepID=A0AA35J0M2_SACMI|nr:uncharacterized protein SMKI_07G2740 [Saccharomyces mikatae IFO 1815]CAI4039291.1 hypothetical protein SMKI_07G2740 [Saccharomyces mikatae IFO 1815]